jgi:hypothetical protein
MRWVADIRGVREVANWNTLIMFRRKAGQQGSDVR